MSGVGHVKGGGRAVELNRCCTGKAGSGDGNGCSLTTGGGIETANDGCHQERGGA